MIYFFNFSMWASFTVWAFALIVNEKEEVLLVKRKDNGMWNLPWWGMNSFESPWECVVREVKEETKLDVKVNRLVWLYSKSNIDDFVFCFLCDIIWWTIWETDEWSEFWWFWCKDLPDNIIDRHKDRIINFFNDKNKLVMNKS